jgi:hypothetical protein
MINQLIKIAFVVNILAISGSVGALNLGDLVNTVDKVSKVAKQNAETNSNVNASAGRETNSSVSTYTNKSPNEITGLLQAKTGLYIAYDERVKGLVNKRVSRMDAAIQLCKEKDLYPVSFNDLEKNASEILAASQAYYQSSAKETLTIFDVSDGPNFQIALHKDGNHSYSKDVGRVNWLVSVLACKKVSTDEIKSIEERQISQKKQWEDKEKLKNPKYSQFVSGSENCKDNDKMVCDTLLEIYKGSLSVVGHSALKSYLSCESLTAMERMSNFGIMIKNNNNIHKVCLKLMEEANNQAYRESGKFIMSDRDIISMNNLLALVKKYK